ncbi:hypothetical protein O3P69_001724 [Scylla paramamosain]|uniref:Uncharacterized protein n=3 Tax=Scylla paramamosain TaxID=85552 RepID=A0AAW0V1Q3_SCYPA
MQVSCMQLGSGHHVMVDVIRGSHDGSLIVIVRKMESEEWNPNHFAKYYFQVFLEDEEENSLFMDSWIYLDQEADEELSCAKEYQSPHQDVTDITKKLGDGCKLSQAESCPCNSSAEDNQRNFPVTVPHFQNIHKTSIEHTPKEDSASETTCTDVSEVCSSEPPPKALYNRTDVSEHAMVVYGVEGENSVKTSDSSVVETPGTVSESFLSVIADDIGFNETHTQSSDVCSSGENIAKTSDNFVTRSTDIVSKSVSSEVVDADIDSDETNTYSSDLCISKDKNTAETLASGVDKSSDIIYKSLLSVTANDIIDCNETSTHPSHMYSKVKSKLPDIHSSKSFLHEVMNSARDSSETYMYSTDMCSVKEENIKETPHTHVSKTSSSETVKFDMDPFIKSESNCPSKREIKPISSKIQKNSFEDMEVTIIDDDDDEPQIITSDDEAPIVISDDKDSDSSDIEIIYVGAHQLLSACTAIKDEKPPLDKKIKHEHQKKNYTNVIPANYSSDLMICKEITVSQLTTHRPQKAVEHPKTSSSYCSDVIQERKNYSSNPEIINLEPSKLGRKRKRREHKSPRISLTNVDSVFIPNEKNLVRLEQKYVHNDRSDSFINMQLRNY